MHVQDMAARAQRGIDTREDRHRASPIPNIDYATLAQGMGVYGEGPIANPNDLGPAHQARARSGEARRAGADRRRHAAPLGRQMGR